METAAFTTTRRPPVSNPNHSTESVEGKLDAFNRQEKGPGGKSEGRHAGRHAGERRNPRAAIGQAVAACLLAALTGNRSSNAKCIDNGRVVRVL